MALSVVPHTLEVLIMDLENEKNDIGRDSIALWVLNPPEPPCMLYRILKNLKEAQLGVTLFSLKHQNSPKIVFTFLQALFPIFASFKNYNVHKFKSDVLGGLILAIFAIPQVQLLINQHIVLTCQLISYRK